MVKRLRALLTALACLIGTLPAEGAGLTLAASPLSEPDKLRVELQKLGDYLSERLGEPVAVVINRSYAETAARLGDGSADIAWLSALGYVRVMGGAPGTRYLATYVSRDPFSGEIAPYYRSVIVARADSGIDTLADLKGKRFAFTDPISASGYAVPLHMLREHGIDPERDFAKVFLLKRHDRVVDALLHDSVDAGALADDIYHAALKRHGAVIKEIARSEPIPLVAIVASEHLAPATAGRLREALLALPPDHAFLVGLREAFGWYAAGFRVYDDALYDSVRAVYGDR